MVVAMYDQAVQYGMDVGRTYIDAHAKRYIPWLTSMWHSLKYYFAVNHAYVGQKLLTVLLPFRKKQWSR
jgi:hypothetical protein